MGVGVGEGLGVGGGGLSGGMENTGSGSIGTGRIGSGLSYNIDLSLFWSRTTINWLSCELSISKAPAVGQCVAPVAPIKRIAYPTLIQGLAGFSALRKGGAWIGGLLSFQSRWRGR